MSLTFITACHPGDQDKALKLLNFIAELGKVPFPGHILCCKDCDSEVLVEAGKKAFQSYSHILDHEAIKCDWSSNKPGPRDASGANSVFKQSAWHQHLPKGKGPWMWLEPDCLPLSRDWAERLWAEYQSCGKPVMGDYITANSPHFSGVSIYPDNLPQLFGKMIHDVDGAFDVSDAKRVIANGHVTKLIQDCWRTEGMTPELFEKLRPEAVLFAGIKNQDQMIPFIRRKLGMAGAAPEIADLKREFVTSKCIDDALKSESERFMADPVLRSLGAKQDAPVVDIYLKTYPKDHELINYCLRSIHKFVKGHRRIIVEAEMSMGWENHNKDLWFIQCEDREPGYIDQQAKKLAAFKHTDAEYLLYVDSDCCFQRPFDVSEMFKEGKSTWQYIPLEKARDDQKAAWAGVMQAFLGKLPQHEYMRRHPHILPRWLPEEMDKFCKYRHGKSLEEYIMAQGDPTKPLQLSFSEFNCAGFFAWEFFRDRIAWITDAEATPAPLVQGFTHGGQDRIKADIEKAKAILGEDQPITEVTTGPVTISAPLETVLSLDSALSVLNSEAAKSPLHKARLWKRITAALSIETKPQAPKRRRKGAKKKLPSFQLGAEIPVKRQRGRPKKKDEDIFKSKLVTGKAENRMRAKSEDQAMVDASLCLQPKGWAPSKDGFILAVQTYPGGNEAFGRHERSFIHSGASRRVAITTTDGYCYIPEGFEEVKIGENKYISGDHLPKRLTGILEWFLKQPEERIAIVEYDVLFFKPLKPWTGTCLVPAGGQLPGAKSDKFYHVPWLFDKESAKRLLPQMYGIIAEGVCNTGPEASPDVFLAYAVDRAGITVNTNHFTRFTRNSLNRKGDLELARQHYRDGVDCLHGCKTKSELEYILS